MLTRPKRPPRFINHLSGAEQFLAAWDDASHSRNREIPRIVASANGNLNASGEPGNYVAPAVPRFSAAFESSLEPGVRPLVLLFARDIGWRTYTSCEGHCYADPSLPPTERHIGFLPRDDAELAAMTSGLDRLTRAANSRSPFAAVVLDVVVHTLSTEGRVLPAVELYFSRGRFTSWRRYSRSLPEASLRTLNALQSGVISSPRR
jgi:uncharacterized protein